MLLTMVMCNIAQLLIQMVDRGRYQIEEDAIYRDADLSDQDASATHLDKEDFKEEDAVIMLRGTILRPQEDIPGFPTLTRIITII